LGEGRGDGEKARKLKRKTWATIASEAKKEKQRKANCQVFISKQIFKAHRALAERLAFS